MGTELANQPQHSQCSESSTTPNPSSFYAEKLKPCGSKAGTAELMACLTLVSPSGMTAEDRHAWVAVARQTLSGIPADLLARGCAKARATCRFASEIVPVIIEEVQGEWNRRKRNLAEDEAIYANRNAPQLEKPAYATPEDVERIKREVAEEMKAKAK